MAGFGRKPYASCMTTPSLPQTWPYPRWIAHRGAGKLAPENTLAAFKWGQEHGFSMFECDVKLSKDGVPFLLHDATLERTTNGLGVAGEKTWADLCMLDAGSWHSKTFQAEPLLKLQDLCTWLMQHRLLVNLEIKPTPGEETRTGQVVAQSVQAWWNPAHPWPLLSSFEVFALQAAQAQAPHIPRALLLDQWRDGWLQEAQQLQCVAVVPRHTLLTSDAIAQAHEAGLKVLTYTVNEPSRAQDLWKMGLDGLITDAVDTFASQAKAERTALGK
jgi:glycerophosphoryl diester phosphodiesterase